MKKSNVKTKLKRHFDAQSLKQPIKNTAVYALYLVSGFILSLAGITSELKPLALSFVAVSKKQGCIFSTIGACLGYLALGFNESSARYFCAVIIVGAIAFLVQTLSLSHIIAIPLISTFSTCLISGVFMNIKLEADITQYLLTLAESILTLGVTYFYFKSINANFTQLRFKALPTSDIACITISVSTLFLGFGQLKIGSIMPFLTAAGVIVLFAVRYANEKWGVICALSFGFVLGIPSENGAALCGAMGLAATVSALFAEMSILGVGLSYLAVCSFFAITLGGEYGLTIFLNSALSVAIFLLMPSKICDKIEQRFFLYNKSGVDGALRQNLVLKLRFASNAMKTISDSVEQVSERFDEVAQKRSKRLKQTLSKEQYISKEVISQRTNQVRMVATDQFLSIAEMLNDLATEFAQAEAFDSQAQDKIRQLLSEYGIYAKSVSAITDKYGRMRVEILTSSPSSKLSDKHLQYEIGKICDRYFDVGRITKFSKECMLSFTQKPNYIISVGFAQYSAEGELCGDTVKIINDGKGHSVLIISDGMGKGSSAALDGAMGAGLISRLINAGFGFDSALKIVNSALLLKSNEESLATLDIASIDLFTGKCEIFKAGAPSGYIIKNSVATKCELSSMPAGILRGIEFAKRTAILSPSDSIILMSDGITDLGDEWLNEIFVSLPYQPQECADYILSRALEETKNKKRDDMSVIYARLEKN